MNLITTDTLHQLGIHKSATEEAELVTHFQDTLNERVGLTIMDLLEDEQVARLIELTEAGDQDATTAFLQQTVPGYEQLVTDEYDILMGELAESADSL
jgi:hypothetical protein